MTQFSIKIRQGHSSSLYDMPLFINWTPTMFCNFHCSYCSNGDFRSKGCDWLDLDHNKAIFDNLLRLNRPYYHISIAGGEPTVYPGLCDMLDYITSTYGSRLSRIHMTSNGSTNHEIYERLGTGVKSGKLTLYISIHTDHVKLEDIKAMTATIAPNGFLGFALMFNPAKREYTRDIYELLCQLRKNYPFALTIDTLREAQNGGIIDRRYKPEDFAWQRDAMSQFAAIAASSDKKAEWHGKNVPGAVQNYALSIDGYQITNICNQNRAYQEGVYDLKGCYCALGTNVFNLLPDGRVGSAVCRQARISRKPVYEESPYSDPEFACVARCGVDVCGCRANDFLMRFAREDEAQEYLKHFRLKQERLIAEGKKAEQQKAIMTALGAALCSDGNAGLPQAVDQEWYYAQYPDVERAEMPAGVHYFLHGWKEGRNPAPWFNTKFYLETYPDVAQSGINPLEHYLLKGIREGRQPAAE